MGNTDLKSNVYTCTKCGFSIISNKKIDKCMLCKGELSTKQINSVESQEKIIPFKINKSECISILKKSLLPFVSKYSVSKLEKSMYKLYLPALLFDFEMSGDIVLDGKVESTWKSDNYKYIKNDEYKITSSCNSRFDKLLINCSNNIDNKLLEKIEPFDYDDIKEKDLSNELVIYYKKDINDVINKANDEFVNTIMNRLHNYKELSVKKLKINRRIGTFDYYLLPVYLLNINNNIILVNGQTGKVSNNLSVSKFKIVIFSILIFIIYFILILFIIRVIK